MKNTFIEHKKEAKSPSFSSFTFLKRKNDAKIENIPKAKGKILKPKSLLEKIDVEIFSKTKNKGGFPESENKL